MRHVDLLAPVLADEQIQTDTVLPVTPLTYSHVDGSELLETTT